VETERTVSLIGKVLPSKSGLHLNLPPAPKPLSHIYFEDIDTQYDNGAPAPKIDLHGIENEALRKASSFLATIILGDIDFTLELKDKISVLTAIQNHLPLNDPRHGVLREYRDIMFHNIHFWEAANIKNLRTQQAFDYTIKMNEVQEAVAKKQLEQRTAKTKKMKEFLQRNLAEFKEKEEAKVIEYLGEVYHRLESKVMTIPARFKRDFSGEFSASRKAVVESGSKAIRDQAGSILQVLFSV
jgi:hypothetical protein